MIYNYLLVAWRNIRKNKVFSFINIVGLATGLTCCMLITLYLFHELSFDKHHKNGDRVYQLGTVFIKQGKEERTANTPAPMGKTMQMAFPEIEKAARLLKAFADDKTLMQYKTSGGTVKSFYEPQGYLADSTFFHLLTYQFKEGDYRTALTAPNSLVLSEEIAGKMFGSEPALGKIVHINSSTNGEYDFTVTGVLAKNSKPSHIDAKFFMSLSGGQMEEYVLNRGTDLASNNMFYTYLLLKPGSDAKKLEAKFPAFIDKYAGADLKAIGIYKKQFLTEVKDVHLYANTISNVSAGGSVTYLYILGSIAVFTLLIACINFMNLSTARSSKRSAEVGVRKVLGAEKSSLLKQFLGESILMSLGAFIFALVLAWMLLPLFANASGKELSFQWGEHGFLIAGFFLLAIVTGLIAGSYPAFYLSSFKPIKVLKGRFQNSFAAVSLRKGLVVFQFVISVVLIVASVVIIKQMNFMRSIDLGFVKEQQILVPLRSSNAKNIFTSFKNEISRDPRVQSVGASLYYPGIFNPRDMPLYKEGKNMNEARRVFINIVDNNFMQTLGIKLVAGRLFSPQFPGDTTAAIILNEKAVSEMGFVSAQDAVGKRCAIDWQGQNYRFDIVGVVKNFNFKDLRSDIEPYGFQLNNDNVSHNYLFAHTKGQDVQAVLASFEKQWRQLNPNEPFEYSFLDDDFAKTFVAESRLSSIVGYFTVIAILISCLGLFGLATFSAEQRTKEIGIRKVLGASTTGLAGLLSKDFLKLVLVAVVIASPIAWFVMDKWLQDFAFRTKISWVVFAITAVSAVGIALLTVAFQAIRSALSNPVQALRSE